MTLARETMTLAICNMPLDTLAIDRDVGELGYTHIYRESFAYRHRDLVTLAFYSGLDDLGYRHRDIGYIVHCI